MKQILAKSKLFLFFIAVYVLFAFVLPASNATKAAYNLSNEQYHILYFLVSLPTIVLWLAAYYAYRRLAAYASVIQNTKEGPDFASITRGMCWIAWGFLGPTIASQLLGAFSYPSTHPQSFAIIIIELVNVIVAVVAFNYFSTASRQLTQRVKIQFGVKTTKRLIAIFVLFGVIFCYGVFHSLQTAQLNNAYNAYYLPVWLVVITIVVPSLYAWFVGLLAAYELTLLARHSGGILYRHAIKLLAFGLALVIVSSSGLQYMRSLVPRSGHLSLGPLLLVAYALYATCVTGCLLLATGARRLAKIEEV